jgi:hypothetical protein
MERPKITEIPRKMEPVDHDTFIDDLGGLVVAQEVEIKEQDDKED